MAGLNWRRHPMRALFSLLCLMAMPAYAQYPSPTFAAITVQTAGAQINGPATVTGAMKATGGGQFSGTFAGPMALGSVQLGLLATTQAGLASLSAGIGTQVFVTDCANGNQSGGGVSGCPAFLDTAGTWRLQASPSGQAITIGGQAVTLGGSTANQGNGPKIQLGTGSFTAGNALVFDALGNAVDSGVVPSGGTGGGGTVAPGLQGSPAIYTNAGTSSTVGPVAIVNNAVLVTSSSGIMSESVTLPTGLNIPSATLPSPTLTGSISIGTASYTGKQTFLASTSSSAGANLPAGVAPSAPAPGDHWATSAGLFYRAGAVTQGPFVGSVATTGPLTGGGVGPSLTLACATCATTTNGGTLTGTAPITISAGGTIALGTIIKPVTWLADATTVVHNDIYPLFTSPWTQNATVQKIISHTGGTASPAFTAAINICTSYGGTCTPVTGCTQSVSSTTDATATCTALNTLPPGQVLELIISGTTGSPSSASVQTFINQPAS